jgi:radical SAM protein with 4Fe4S-binding SPASM domain
MVTPPVNLPSSPASGRKFPQKLVDLKTMKRHLIRLYNTLETEFNFRFRRAAIRAEMEQVRQFPRNLHIEGTNVCNAKCTFCAYPQMERAKETMPMETFQRIVDEYVEMGGKGVSLTPIVGDPFVDRHIFERLDYLNQKPEIRGFYFYTNGILMKPAIIDRLLTYSEKLHVFVSFGGFDRETYKAIMGVDYFDLVSKNIEAFMAAKQRTGSRMRFDLALRCPPSSWTGEFWAKCNAYKQQGLMNIHSAETFDSWAGKVNPAELKQVGLVPTLPPYKRGACELLFAKPIVLANGKVNACACRDVEAELIVGDLTETPLKELWAGQEINNIIEQHEQGNFPDVCRRCTWYNSIYNTRKRQLRVHRVAKSWDQD